MKKLTIALAFILWSASANAQGFDEATSLKIHNLIEDYIACVVFYTISAVHVNSDDTEVAEKFKSGAETFLFRAHTLSQAINMKEETIRAKMQLHRDDQMEAINHDAVNYSILLNKYGKTCQHLHDNTEQVLKERGLE